MRPGVRPAEETSRRLRPAALTGAILVLLAAVGLIFGVPNITLAAPVTIDDFDDNSIDSTKWTVYNVTGGGVPVVSEQNQRLEVFFPSDVFGSLT